ncbi:hypothetical protein [Vibrio phage phiKT1019]|nr:hypothetical protein [Vibrio phage phiKT1019]
MKELIEKYQRLVIYRQSLIMLIAAPVPAAMIKLQGELLNEQTIALIIILGNLFSMCGTQLNKLSTKLLFIGGNVISVIAVLGIVMMYLGEIGNSVIVVYFPIVSCMGFLLVGLASGQVNDAMKNKYKEEFDISHYNAKKASFASAAMVMGQGIALVFYNLVDVDPIMVLLFLETVNCVLYLIAEINRWGLIKEMELELKESRI